MLVFLQILLIVLQAMRIIDLSVKLLLLPTIIWFIIWVILSLAVIFRR